MAKCVKCGKSGLFLRLSKSGKCDLCVREEKERYEQMRREHEEDQRKYAYYSMVKDKFDRANALPLSERIAAYENLLKEYPDYSGARDATKQLAVFCRMAKQYNKAWGLLNKVVMLDMGNPDRTGTSPSIRYEQYLVLLDEEKYLPAIQFLCSFYVLRGECPPSFYKNLRTLTNKIGKSKEQTEAVVDLVHRMNDDNNTDEQYLRDELKVLLA